MNCLPTVLGHASPWSMEGTLYYLGFSVVGGACHYPKNSPIPYCYSVDAATNLHPQGNPKPPKP